MDKPKKKNSVSEYPFKFVEKNHKRKSLEGRFQKKIQTAVSGTDLTVTTESGKLIHRKHISGSIVFQTEKKRKNGHRKSETRSHRKTDTVVEASTANTFSGMKYYEIY